MLIDTCLLQLIICISKFGFTYFFLCSAFGYVEDVRIPCQQKRMFGFVTFADPETVRMILDKGNPHHVRGSRVLVKPYREKTKVVERSEFLVFSFR